MKFAKLTKIGATSRYLKIADVLSKCRCAPHAVYISHENFQDAPPYYPIRHLTGAWRMVLDMDTDRKKLPDTDTGTEHEQRTRTRTRKKVSAYYRNGWTDETSLIAKNTSSAPALPLHFLSSSLLCAFTQLAEHFPLASPEIKK